MERAFREKIKERVTAHLWEQKRKWEESEITWSFQTWEPKGGVVVTKGGRHIRCSWVEMSHLEIGM